MLCGAKVVALLASAARRDVRQMDKYLRHHSVGSGQLSSASSAQLVRGRGPCTEASDRRSLLGGVIITAAACVSL